MSRRRCRHDLRSRFVLLIRLFSAYRVSAAVTGVTVPLTHGKHIGGEGGGHTGDVPTTILVFPSGSYLLNQH